MKKLLLAVTACASLIPFSPAAAQGIYFEFGDSPRYYDEDSPRLYRAPPRYYRDRYYPSRYEPQRCWRQPYQVRSHNHEITRYRTVCAD
jgi:hypothetical protein